MAYIPIKYPNYIKKFPIHQNIYKKEVGNVNVSTKKKKSVIPQRKYPMKPNPMEICIHRFVFRNNSAKNINRLLKILTIPTQK